jgi:hypothetical protein
VPPWAQAQDKGPRSRAAARMRIDMQRIVPQAGARKKKGGPRRPLLFRVSVTACADHNV